MNSFSCSSAGPDRPLNDDVWAARRGAGWHAGGEDLRGDGGHSWRRTLRVQNLHALHPRTQRGVSLQSLRLKLYGVRAMQWSRWLFPFPPRWIAYSHVDFSGDQYILEKGFYNNCADWGSQDNRICSVQPILLVRTTWVRKTMSVLVLRCHSPFCFVLFLQAPSTGSRIKNEVTMLSLYSLFYAV